jgi:hypothetical protein
MPELTAVCAVAAGGVDALAVSVVEGLHAARLQASARKRRLRLKCIWMQSAVAEGSRDHAVPAGRCMCRKARFSGRLLFVIPVEAKSMDFALSEH